MVRHVAGEGVEVLPVGVSVLRSQLVVAQISCLPRLPYNNLTCTEARGRRLSGTRPGPGAAPQLPSTITLLTGSFCSIYHWCPMSMTTIVAIANLTDPIQCIFVGTPIHTITLRSTREGKEQKCAQKTWIGVVSLTNPLEAGNLSR